MSKLETNQVDPATGTKITLGTSGETISIPSGVTIANSGTATGFGGTNTPSFMVLLASSQSINSGTSTVIAFDTEIFDTNNAVSSGVFTVPSGEAGKYFFAANGGLNTGNNVGYVNIWLSKNSQTTIASTNGEAIGIEFYHAGVDGDTNHINQVSGTFDLAVGDTVRVYMVHNYGSAKDSAIGGRFTFSGHKLL